MRVIDFLHFLHLLKWENERIQHGVDEALPQAAVVVKNQEQEDDV